MESNDSLIPGLQVLRTKHQFQFFLLLPLDFEGVVVEFEELPRLDGGSVSAPAVGVVDHVDSRHLGAVVLADYFWEGNGWIGLGQAPHFNLVLLLVGDHKDAGGHFHLLPGPEVERKQAKAQLANH